jgi:hypothetical protein
LFYLVTQFNQLGGQDFCLGFGLLSNLISSIPQYELYAGSDFIYDLIGSFLALIGVAETL